MPMMGGIRHKRAQRGEMFVQKAVSGNVMYHEDKVGGQLLVDTQPAMRRISLDCIVQVLWKSNFGWITPY